MVASLRRIDRNMRDPCHISETLDCQVWQHEPAIGLKGCPRRIGEGKAGAVDWPPWPVKAVGRHAIKTVRASRSAVCEYFLLRGPEEIVATAMDDDVRSLDRKSVV